MISYNAALVYSVVLAAAADGRVEDDELKTIKSMTLGLPVFIGFDEAKFFETAAACTDLLTEEEGLDAAIEIIRQSLPAKLCSTAKCLNSDPLPFSRSD